MSAPAAGRSRRWALTRVGAALGGGLGVTGAASPLSDTAQAATRSPAARSFTVTASGLRVVSGLPAAGTGHRAGDRWLVTGALDREGVPGTVVSEVTTVAATTREAGPLATVEHHTFTFAEDTLIGAGTSGHYGRDGVFAVVGGTGRYLGVRGSYTAVQRLTLHGGDGSAVFSFTVLTTTEEAL